MKVCKICGTTTKRLIKHHTDYENDITVLLCYKCHSNLHKGNIKSDIPAPKRPLRKRNAIQGNAKEVKTMVSIKKGGKIYVPIRFIDYLGAKPGDLIEVIIRKEDKKHGFKAT